MLPNGKKVETTCTSCQEKRTPYKTYLDHLAETNRVYVCHSCLGKIYPCALKALEKKQ